MDQLLKLCINVHCFPPSLNVNINIGVMLTVLESSPFSGDLAPSEQSRCWRNRDKLFQAC